MAGRNPERLAGLIMEALAKSGQRGLLLTGWGGLRTASTPDSVFVTDSAPHSWLFRAWLPWCITAGANDGGRVARRRAQRGCPFCLRSALWGARIKALGLGRTPFRKSA